MENEIRVAELFAGVGGFRLGLEGWNGFKFGRYPKGSGYPFQSFFVPQKGIFTTIPNAKAA